MEEQKEQPETHITLLDIATIFDVEAERNTHSETSNSNEQTTQSPKMSQQNVQPETNFSLLDNAATHMEVEWNTYPQASSSNELMTQSPKMQQQEVEQETIFIILENATTSHIEPTRYIYPQASSSNEQISQPAQVQKKNVQTQTKLSLLNIKTINIEAEVNTYPQVSSSYQQGAGQTVFEINTSEESSSSLSFPPNKNVQQPSQAKYQHVHQSTNLSHNIQLTQRSTIPIQQQQLNMLNVISRPVITTQHLTSNSSGPKPLRSSCCCANEKDLPEYHSQLPLKRRCLPTKEQPHCQTFPHQTNFTNLNYPPLPQSTSVASTSANLNRLPLPQSSSVASTSAPPLQTVPGNNLKFHVYPKPGEKDFWKTYRKTSNQIYRINIRSGINNLRLLLPERYIKNCINKKNQVCSVDIVEKSADYLSDLCKENNAMREKVWDLRRKAAIRNYNNMFPNNSTPGPSLSTMEVEETPRGIMSDHEKNKWMYQLFCFALQPIVESFNAAVSTDNLREFRQFSRFWLDQNSSCFDLRKDLRNSLSLMMNQLKPTNVGLPQSSLSSEQEMQPHCSYQTFDLTDVDET